MNDDVFFDLAMKSLFGQASDSERQKLESLLSSNPSLKTEFERLRGDVRLAKEVLPLLDAMQAKGADLPGFARQRLELKVRQAFSQKRKEQSADDDQKALAWGWKWLLGLAATVAVAVLVVLPMLLSAPKPQVQIAMLDLAGPTRGVDTNDVAAFLETWRGAPFTNFSYANELSAWEKSWPTSAKQYEIKIIYNRAAAEILVLGKGRGREFGSTFSVGSDLHDALLRAETFIRQQTSKGPTL